MKLPAAAAPAAPWSGVGAAGVCWPGADAAAAVVVPCGPGRAAAPGCGLAGTLAWLGK
jgi:hypothetical protein